MSSSNISDYQAANILYFFHLSLSPILIMAKSLGRRPPLHVDVIMRRLLANLTLEWR